MSELPLTRRAARERSASFANDSRGVDAEAASGEAVLEPTPLAPRAGFRLTTRGLAVVVGALAVALAIAVFTVGSALAQRTDSPAAASTGTTGRDAAQGAAAPVPPPPIATELPVPVVSQAAVAPAAAASCDDPAIVAALAGGSDADVIAAFGGGERFRVAVAGGTAPCVSLTEPQRVWMVVNKRMPIAIEGYLPELVYADGIRNLVSGELRPDVNDALGALGAASVAEGAGELGIMSAARADWSQRRLYDREYAANGKASADANTARPGYSEHQTGLAVDLVACAGGCGSIEGFGATAQGEWVAENAWRFGFIVRYEEGYTPVTGYIPEAWHLRYLGTELAVAYHAGGFHTLEDFFGLPAAPDYGD